MGAVIVIFIIAIALFFFRQRNYISKDTLQAIVETLAIISSLAAISFFISPQPTSPDPSPNWVLPIAVSDKPIQTEAPTNTSRLSTTHTPTSVQTSPSTPSAARTPTSTPTSSEVKLEILIPLYNYPNWYDPDNYIWDDVAAASSQVPITAIINPLIEPGWESNIHYVRALGLSDLPDVTMVGYVATNYGNRSIDEVKADVDLYNAFIGIDGIFFDQVTRRANELSYYQELYDYVKSRSNLDKVIINPGVNVDEDYINLPASDVAVIYANEWSQWLNYQPDAYMATYPAGRFAMLVYGASQATMQSHIDLAKQRNIGYVYLTDDTLPNPWDTLPSFWQDEINYIEQINDKDLLVNATPVAVESFDYQILEPNPDTIQPIHPTGFGCFIGSQILPSVAVQVINVNGEGLDQTQLEELLSDGSLAPVANLVAPDGTLEEIALELIESSEGPQFVAKAESIPALAGDYEFEVLFEEGSYNSSFVPVNSARSVTFSRYDSLSTNPSVCRGAVSMTGLMMIFLLMFVTGFFPSPVTGTLALIQPGTADRLIAGPWQFRRYTGSKRIRSKQLEKLGIREIILSKANYINLNESKIIKVKAKDMGGKWFVADKILDPSDDPQPFVDGIDIRYE